MWSAVMWRTAGSDESFFNAGYKYDLSKFFFKDGTIPIVIPL